MAEEQQGGASFNPDDASGLIDRLVGKITAVVVDYFTTKPTDGSAPKKLVNVDVTYEGGGQKTTEHYLLGNAEEWAPNATKTGAVPTKPGNKVWNKSDVIKWTKSLIDAGFPKALVGSDLSVFVGTGVEVSRITQEGSTYTDKKTGKERTRTIMLVTKVTELPKKAQVAAGKPAPASKPAAAAKTAPAQTEAAPAASGEAADDALLTEIIVEAVSSAPLAKEALKQPIFIQATRRKVTPAQRKALQERSQDDAFLASLAEGGLIGFDGTTVSAA